MTTESELIALAERVEAATGPDRELDFEILCSVDHRAAKTGPVSGDPAYTASLDSAMTLVSEGAKWTLDSHYNMAAVCVYWDGHQGPEMSEYPGEGRNPALALTAAALRARAAAQVSA